MNISIYIPVVDGSAPPVPLPDGVGNMVVATYNWGYEGDDSADYRINAIHDQFVTNQVEIASIQELRFEGSSQEIDALADHFSGWYVVRTPHNEEQEYENAIISQYPIVGGSQVNVVIPGDQDRTNISVKIDTPIGDIRVWSIHTRADDPLYGADITVQGVKDLSDAEPTIPIILMGDFNLSYKDTRDLVDSIFPEMISTKLSYIDHIFVYQLFVVGGYSAPRVVAGQHDPVFATVTNEGV